MPTGEHMKKTVRTVKMELTIRELEIIVNSLGSFMISLNDEKTLPIHTKVSLSAETENLMIQLNEAKKNNSQLAREAEPRQPVRRPIQQPQEEVEETEIEEDYEGQ